MSDVRTRFLFAVSRRRSSAPRSESGLPKSSALPLLLTMRTMNAGIGTTGLLATMSQTQIEALIRLNTLSPILLSKAVARSMMAQGSGRIINMSSINAVVAMGNQVPYCVSKGGIDQLTKVMALSLAPYGIRVNAIGPGSIMTDILKSVATDKEAITADQVDASRA